MLKGFVVGVVVGTLLFGVFVYAQSNSSMEIHMKNGDQYYFYTCVPGAPVEDDYVGVYVFYTDGIAGYTCTLDGGAHTTPFIPTNPEKRVMR